MIRSAEGSFFNRHFWNLQIKRARDKSKTAKTRKTREKWNKIVEIFRDKERYLSIGS